MLKRINLILATLIILANVHFLPMGCTILFKKGGPMGVSYLLLPILIPINALLIPALFTFKRKFRSHPGFLTSNLLGVAWITYWILRIIGCL